MRLEDLDTMGVSNRLPKSKWDRPLVIPARNVYILKLTTKRSIVWGLTKHVESDLPASSTDIQGQVVLIKCPAHNSYLIPHQFVNMEPVGLQL